MSVPLPWSDSSVWVAAATTALSLLVVSALIVALSLVTRIVFRKRSASTHVLMGRVTIGCLLMVPIGVVLSPAFPAVRLVRGQADSNPVSRQPHQIAPEGSLDVHRFGRSEPASDAPSSLAPPPRDPFEPSRRPLRFGTLQVAFGIWCFVAALLLIRLSLSHLAAWRMWRRSKPIASEHLRRVCAIHSNAARTVVANIHQSSEVQVPVCLGLFRRRVLLPQELEDWTSQQIRWCLDHELVHVDRRDVLWSTLTELLVCVYWINPLIWLFRRSFLLDVESACDDEVLAGERDSAGYAELLVGIARRASEANGSAARAVVAVIPMAAVNGFRKRVERIVDTSRDRRPIPRFAAWFIAVVGIIGTASALAIRPELAALPDDASQSQDTSNERTRDQPPRFSAWHEGMTAGRVDIVDAAWINSDQQLARYDLQELDAILALDPISAMMLANQIGLVPRNERPALHALGVTPNVLAMLETGRLDKAVSRQPYELGYRTVEMLVRERRSMLPEGHPPRLIIPARGVDRSGAAFLVREFEEGRTLTLDSRLDQSGLSLVLEFPSCDHPEHAAWWELVLLGCEQAADQFGSELNVIWEDRGTTTSQPSFFGFNEFALAFPVSESANSIFAASDPVVGELPAESRFVLRTSTTQMAEVTARMIATDRSQKIKLAIIGHETFKPTAESFLPILIHSLRGL